MTIGTVLFFASAAVTGLICVILVKLRIGAIRDARMKAFFPLCLAAMGWIMMNAAINVTLPAAFAAFYTVRMAFACTIPYLNCWFFLHFSESKMTRSRLLRLSFPVMCTADILAVLTNPLHRLYFVNYANPFPERGVLAALHVVALSVVMALAYAALFPYIAKNFRRHPLLLLTGFGAFVPYVLYLLYVLQIIRSRYDLSPLGFFFSVILFAYFSYASRMAYAHQDTLNNVLKEIMQSSAVSGGNAEDAAKIIAKKGCLALGASRVGIWGIEGTVGKNIAAFSRPATEYRVQEELHLSDGQRYLDTLASERLIVVDDISHPNVLTDTFKDDYRPQVRALMEAPVRVEGKVVGVIGVEQDRCEAYPERREWMLEEQSFVSTLADYLGIAIISGKHHALAARNEELMANMPGAIFRCVNNPPEYTITFVSPGIRALTGYTPEELIGGGTAKLFARMHPEDAAHSFELIEKTLRRGLPMETWFRLGQENGEEKWIWERSKVVKTAPDGTPELFEGFYTDITDQRRREAAVAASEAKSAFLAQMSHEMRTPLSAVIGLSELVLENGGLSQDNEAYLDKIYNAGSTLLSIVNDILDISKIEAGKFELLPQEYDVPSLINDAITQNILRIHSKPVHFTLHMDESAPARLRGDDIRVKQILSNLLSNAFKYTDEGTVELHIGYERQGPSVWTTFRVIDTGIGIRPEEVELLFTDYTRLDGDANRKIGGTGLGLSITKRLAELMDGTVTAQSEYGKGSVFTARIRQQLVNDSVIGSEMAEHLRNFLYTTSKRRSGSQLNRIQIPGARVLVVDDNLTNLDIARGLMRPYGMDIDCVTGGQAAIDAIRGGKRKYAAIFMDHMMPGMDGVEAVRIIREEIGSEYAKTVPIIALTANALAGNPERFIRQGFNAFVSKPIDIFRLDSVIRKWIWDRMRAPGPEGQRKFVQRRNRTQRREDDERRAANRRNGATVPAFSAVIEGLDWMKGIALFGDADSYRQVLRSFAANTKPLLAGLGTPDKETLNPYAITVHGIKSSSRGVCAHSLGSLAESLEFAAKDGNLDYVIRHNPAFLAAARKLIADIEALLEKGEKTRARPKKDRPNAGALARLCAACEAYDMDEMEAAMREVDEYTYTDDGGLAVWLRENVARLNYAQVAEKIAQTVKAVSV